MLKSNDLILVVSAAPPPPSLPEHPRIPPDPLHLVEFWDPHILPEAPDVACVQVPPGLMECNPPHPPDIPQLPQQRPRLQYEKEVGC